MASRRAVLLLALLTVTVTARAQAQAEGQAGFVLIVNAANSVESLTPEAVSEFFLKQTSRWPDGAEVAPVDLRDGTAARDAFSREIHRKGTAAVEAYWQRMIFSGREVPPPQRGTSSEVVAFVRANPRAIGYVAPGTTLPGGVRALRVAR